MLENTVKCPNS